MAALPLHANWKKTRGPGPSRDLAPSSSPESSLTWCLSHIFKPRPAAADRGNGPGDSGSGREMDKRTKAAQWRALVAIRTQHIKAGGAGIARFRSQGGLRPLLDLLKHHDCSRKILDLALSILANCCTELETRVEVGKLDGITIVVDILKRNVAIETVQNRATRALGNLAMDPENSALIHSTGGVPLLLLCVSLSSAPSSPTATGTKAPCPKLECAQSAARALLYLSDTPSNRLSLLTQGTFSALAPLIAPEYPQGLRRAALRTLHELTRGCGVECAREVSRSGVLAQLGVMVSGESGKPFEELALKTLANVCTHGCLRPLVGSLGVIEKFTNEVKRDPLRSGVFLKALCLCCKEAVNRAKVKENGGLEVLIAFLAAHQSHPLSRLAVMACVDFVYDESALEQLQELGLVPLLVARLVELAKGEEPSADRIDVNATSSNSPTELMPSSCFDSFDFPPPEGSRKDEACKEQCPGSSSFLSLRSWLVSEGLIASEGDLLDSTGSAEGDWGSLQIPPSSSLQSPTRNSDSHSSLKSSLVSHPVCSSTSKQVLQPTPPSSTSIPWPPSVSTPQNELSPTKKPQKPVSPSMLSSAQRKRPRVHPIAHLNKVPLETPPSVPRPQVFHHPYHPEPWAPESPILLLLSRFSHTTDPSMALVNSGIISGLLFYLIQHQDPSVRCFRILCRLSCNPNCLQALVRTGSVALIHHHLCQGEGQKERGGRQTNRVKTKVKQLGHALLNNLRVQCESGFGSGVLAHVMLSGSESDKMSCALSLPLITSNKALLKKLLLDNGGLLLALHPLGCDEDISEEDHNLHSLYFSLLIGCLSSLIGGVKVELDKKHLSLVKTLLVEETRDSLPPPLKKPRLVHHCPYHDSTFDLLFLLDDGTQVSANREAVAGVEGTDRAGSDYFRALLRGSFEEALESTRRPIPIKDVSRGMLIPVLHYLHGCRLIKDTDNIREQVGKTGLGVRGQCKVLGSLTLEGLGLHQEETEDYLREECAFQNTPLGEMMIGACRFLVTELQQQVEDMCVSLLLSYSTRAAILAASLTIEDNGERAVSKLDQECLVSESVDEGLANRTSGLELSGFEAQAEYLSGQTEKPNSSFSNIPHQTDSKKPSTSEQVRKVNRELQTTSDLETIPILNPISKSSCTSVIDKSVHSEESGLRPKKNMKSPGYILKTAAQDSPSSTEVAPGGRALGALLPQVYWFSQRYSYPGLAKACLSLLLGGLESPRPLFTLSSAGDCLRRLAREADCMETLKQDLLSLATVSLS
ncbi:armadillo repeat-containing protein 5 [Lampris incognitus]|uniref:armadillo repeat-containing protein 5 n=1 Tax=Lampris incognitus TaxID=2546036 RepID=UPI0024B57A33|nr:armadillo repeat-containing protein 5 [Lampris incognitus]